MWNSEADQVDRRERDLGWRPIYVSSGSRWNWHHWQLSSPWEQALVISSGLRSVPDLQWVLNKYLWSERVGEITQGKWEKKEARDRIQRRGLSMLQGGSSHGEGRQEEEVMNNVSAIRSKWRGHKGPRNFGNKEVIGNLGEVFYWHIGNKGHISEDRAVTRKVVREDSGYTQLF